MHYSIIPQAKLPRSIEGIFTYSSPQPLNPGDLVIIPFRRQEIMGMVVGESQEKEGKYAVKEIMKKIGSAPEYYAALVQWMGEYYISSAGFIFKTMTPPLPKREKKDVPIVQKFKKKTHVKKYIDYLKKIERVLSAKKTALVVTPTHDSLQLLLEHIAPHLSCPLHTLTKHIYTSKNLYLNTWHAINEMKSGVVVGTRSAIFAPCHNLGSIIIDEADSDDYKQYDMNPRYDARAVARKIGELTGCKVEMLSEGVTL